MRHTARTTWFTALLALWYALVAMPALPVFWASGGEAGPTHSDYCACVSCSDEDVCCCEPPVSGDDQSDEPESESQPDGPAWKPIDCSLSAGWFDGVKAPVVLGFEARADTQVRFCAVPVFVARRNVFAALSVSPPPPRPVV